MTKPKPQSVRPSVLAGRWYPGAQRALARTVDDYLSQAEHTPVPGQLLALISPHAGHAYSGQTAAYAYGQLEGQPVETVVLLGIDHRPWTRDVAVSSEDAYETPLGTVPLDEAFIADLEERSTLRRVSGDQEHSLEIQLPFLQRQLGRFQLVPILLSDNQPQTARHLAAALVKVIDQRSEGEGQILLVASSDLHHIPDYDQVVKRDARVIEAIAAYNLPALTTLFTARDCTVCGWMPILTVLHAARTLGADAVDILHQTNSGDVTGDRRPGQYTVGYMAAAAYKAK